MKITRVGGVMKATLEFDLSDPDDVHDFDVAIRGKDFLRVLQDLDNSLRGKVKYESMGWAQKARDLLYETLDGLELDYG